MRRQTCCNCCARAATDWQASLKTLLPGGENSELVLVVDQFEEVFTLVANEADRIQFLNSLLTAVTDPAGRLRIVITMRA